MGFTVTVHNTGKTPYTGITVTDSFTQMADDASYDTGSAAAKTGGTLSFDSGTHILSWTGGVAPGARRRSPTRSR